MLPRVDLTTAIETHPLLSMQAGGWWRRMRLSFFEIRMSSSLLPEDVLPTRPRLAVPRHLLASGIRFVVDTGASPNLAPPKFEKPLLVPLLVRRSQTAV